MRSDHIFRLHGKQRIAVAALVAALVVVLVLTWTTPQGQRFWRGPTATEVALQTEKARADDLKAQLEKAEERLNAGFDSVGELLRQSAAGLRQLHGGDPCVVGGRTAGHIAAPLRAVDEA